jgi:Domain of unknown function (DUF4390)
MQLWKKIISTHCRDRRFARALLCSVLLSACSGANAPLTVASASIDAGALNVRLRWEPDAVVLDALDHGIALQFKIDVQAQGAANLGWRKTVASGEYHLELRYFPLSRQYRWRDLDHGETRNYSARSLLIAALEDLHLSVPDGFRAADVQRYRLSIELQRDALPGALRLPALLDSKWHMASGDFTWPAG